ncbi:hypothetical protein GS429_00990 [Natronorubrum sp. JWXQ-INN-674]|uniref:Uncharacterized protein n=1 Tax=Natronorubrum halalkaliphilum TaxID=2691917 RepID=A0A6B0VI93_9EURY|nr:hypothetical protein [Natronorubrum halalkaliphilum]MXV60666.1 hypothetical protein [Natronorubrum halalkaliphilum]
MNFRTGLLIVLVVIGAATGFGPTAAVEPTQDDSMTAVGAPEEIDADETRLEVSLQSDGSAEWTVQYRMRLDDNESVDAFESLREDIADDPDAYTAQFVDRIDATVETARDATDREMSADGFAVETSRQTLGTEYGFVTYSFHWHGFAAADGDELHAGDAIEGIYLGDDTRLSIDWPDDYDLVSVEPEPDDRRDNLVIWHGSQTEFVSDEPSVVVSTGGIGIEGIAIGAGLLAIVVAAVGGAWWYRTRSETGATDDGTPSRAAVGPDDAKTEVGSGSGPAPTTDSGPDPRGDLLSNEEQVLRLLEEYDGRMKQQAVIEELEWTDAKTSKVVSGLREEGKLESFRLGRENVLTLPDDHSASDRDPVRNN